MRKKMVERYGKTSLIEKVKGKLKFFIKRSKRIEIKQGIEKYDLRYLYAIPLGFFGGLLIDKYLLFKTKGLYAFVPFSFAILFVAKLLIKFEKKNEVKYLKVFKVKNMVGF